MRAKREKPHKTMADFPNSSRFFPSYLNSASTAIHWIRGLWLALGCVLLMAPGVSAGVLDLAWDAPTKNSDGTPLTDLSLYRVYIGTSGSPCPGPVFAELTSPSQAPTGSEIVSSLVTGLVNDSTDYFVQVTAVDLDGNVSACSI